jgi:hypothetical protein
MNSFVGDTPQRANEIADRNERGMLTQKYWLEWRRSHASSKQRHKGYRCSLSNDGRRHSATQKTPTGRQVSSIGSKRQKLTFHPSVAGQRAPPSRTPQLAQHYLSKMAQRRLCT